MVLVTGAPSVERVERGLGPIGVLVNNAAATQRKLFLESTPADWAAQVDVTVKGTPLITHAVVGLMATRGSGVIVNLMGDSGRVGESRLLVTATARADERMKRMVAQYPLGRVGRADDVTPMVLLLASPRAGWITGQVVSVNGDYAML